MPESLVQDQPLNHWQAINDALNSGMFVHVRHMLHTLPAEDVALLLEASPPKGRTVLWQLVDPEQVGDILEELSEDVKDSVLRLMEPETVAAAAEGMDSDDLAYVLRSLPDAVYREVLASMDSQEQERVEKALSWPEESAGSIMNTDVLSLRPDVTIDVVLRYLRLKGALPEGTDQLYVVDENDLLIGSIPIATLLTVNPNKEVAEVMLTDLAPVPVTQDETEVAKLFERRDLISTPVVDAEGRLLGHITIDDVVDIIREEADHSLMSMAGLEDEEDTFAPVVKSTQRRTLWLGVNLATALIAAAVSNMFEDILAQLATVAILMTIVPSMGGIAGSQTLTLVIRGMALGHVQKGNSRWLISKELAIGLLNGLIWALLIAAVVAVWKESLQLGAIIGFAMFVNMAAAGLSGVLIPLAMKRLGIDPALAGGVVLTTITDVVGLFAFLGTATIYLGTG